MTPDRRLRVAELVTDVLGPVPTGVILALAVGIHSGRGILAGAAWGLLSVVCAAVLPAMASAPLRRQHPRTRTTRLQYMALAIAGAAAGLAVLWLLPAPSDIRVLAAGLAVGLIWSATVNIFYASSNHVAAVAGGTVLAYLLLTPWALVAGAAVALQAWSRATLGLHTVGQGLLGGLVGVLAASAVAVWSTL